jgi:hypothetical protein
VAFFICSQSDAYKDIFTQLIEMTPDSEHIGNFGIQEKRLKNEDYSAELNAFVEKVK